MVLRIGIVAAMIFVLPLLSMFALSEWSSRSLERIENRETEERMAVTVKSVAHPALPPVAVVAGLVDGSYAYAASTGRACKVADPEIEAEVCAALFAWAGSPTRIDVSAQDGNVKTLLVATVARGDSAVVVASDISSITQMREGHRQLTAVVVATFFAMGLGILVLFLRYEFGALSSLVDLLRAYARGEAGARPRQLTTSREVQSLYTSAQDVQRSQEDRAKLSILSTKMETAAKIQRAILPEPLMLPGAQLAGSMTPAEMVGGDFYDWHLTAGGRVAFVVADVSDKGLAAAMVGVQADSALRAMYEQGGDPADALERLNDLLCDRNPELMFVTMLLAEYDPMTGDLQFSSAGHEPPILVNADGQGSFPAFDADASGDPPLGLFPGARYRTIRITVEPGDMFMLYTDGANEAARMDDTRIGRDALLNMVTRLAGQGAQDVVVEIEQMILGDIAPAKLGDDLTFVALTRGESTCDD